MGQCEAAFISNCSTAATSKDGEFKTQGALVVVTAAGQMALRQIN